MNKKELEKLDVLDPKFRKQIEGIFENVNVSISMLYDAATKDKKTDVYNHNFFHTVFEMELEKAERGQQMLTLLLIDIDYFKKINDTYGHIEADKMLKQLASILKKETRTSDIVARFGGEEFIVLFTETGLERAREIASRIRDAIKEDSYLKKFKLTVSGGLTEYAKKDTMDTMLKRADKGLYDAKEAGRDRLISVGPKTRTEFHVKKQKSKKINQIKKINKTKLVNELRKAF